MPESDQSERVARIFGAADVFGNPSNGADFAKHLKASFVCAAVGRSPKASDPGRDASKRIRAG